ncbi:hypothetical protein EVAR_75864_1 [Eumeta japonica]|uniref:Uncharacterized protein n=1 Tax=Eumeta variegata TaxID=151549 RepID=A0A4C1TEB7_EUMVA|nr:hypothetical protein EVAR_75864_1 [Eumeta japonica]
MDRVGGDLCGYCGTLIAAVNGARSHRHAQYEIEVYLVLGATNRARAAQPAAAAGGGGARARSQSTFLRGRFMRTDGGPPAPAAPARPARGRRGGSALTFIVRRLIYAGTAITLL